MSVTARQVKNKKAADGSSTDRSGTVYDVFIKYKVDGAYKTYGKRGFLTKKEALDHEATMRTKLLNPGYVPVKAADTKKPSKSFWKSGWKSAVRQIFVPAPTPATSTTLRTISFHISVRFRSKRLRPQ